MAHKRQRVFPVPLFLLSKRRSDIAFKEERERKRKRKRKRNRKKEKKETCWTLKKSMLSSQKRTNNRTNILFLTIIRLKRKVNFHLSLYNLHSHSLFLFCVLRNPEEFLHSLKFIPFFFFLLKSFENFSLPFIFRFLASGHSKN